MKATPSFRLTPPAPLAWDAQQCSLFAANGTPTPSATTAVSLRQSVTKLLVASRVPNAHRSAFAAHLCKESFLDPSRVLWLNTPARGQRWQSRFGASDVTQGTAALDMQRRGFRLLAYAQATRSWPPCAISALQRQRTAGGAFDLAVLPPVPAQLGSLRHALLPVAMETRARLYAAFALPVRVTRTGQIHSVELLGCFRLHFDFSKLDIRIEVLDKTGWTAAPQSSADLLKPLATDAWCTFFVQRMRQPLRVAMGAAWDNGEVSNAAVAWLADGVRRLADRSRLLELVRSHIRCAYPYDRQVVHDIRGCIIDFNYRQGLTAEGYVFGWRNAATLRTRVAESPKLAAAWGMALRLGLLQTGDDFDKLRDLLRDNGVTPAGWELLRHHGRTLYRPLIGPVRNLRAEFADLCRYVRLLQRAQWREPMPFVLMKALFASHWFAADLHPSDLPLGLIRGAIQRVKSEMPLGGLDAFIEQEFVPVLGWLARAKPVLDTQQQRASWKWYFARYQQWSEAERLQREGQCWTHGIDGLRWRRHDIVPTRDSATLWIDGEQMRMCLNRYAPACAAGQYLVYAVRAHGRPRPIAQIGLCIDARGFATLDQVRGFANAPVEPALAKFAARLAGMHHGAPFQSGD